MQTRKLGDLTVSALGLGCMGMSATKCGIVRDLNNTMVCGIDGSPEYIQRACDRSLRRLGVDAVDLYPVVPGPAAACGGGA